LNYSPDTHRESTIEELKAVSDFPEGSLLEEEGGVFKEAAFLKLF